MWKATTLIQRFYAYRKFLADPFLKLQYMCNVYFLFPLPLPQIVSTHIFFKNIMGFFFFFLNDKCSTEECGFCCIFDLWSWAMSLITLLMLYIKHEEIFWLNIKVFLSHHTAFITIHVDSFWDYQIMTKKPNWHLTIDWTSDWSITTDWWNYSNWYK